MKSIWVALLMCSACSIKALDSKDANVNGNHDAAPTAYDLAAVMSHRVDDSQCTQAAPVGSCLCNTSPCNPTSQFECTTDSMCGDAGANGRCVGFPGPAGCACTADACSGDSDCPTGQTCACHGSAYMLGAGSFCVPGNCRVDSDCGNNGRCSPSPGGSCGQVSGYYCHTASDTCHQDSDCASTGMVDGACQWSATDQHWECVNSLLCV